MKRAHAKALLKDTVDHHFEQIAAIYGDGVVCTLIVRAPAFPDGSHDQVFSTDSLPAALEALRRKVSA